MGKTPVRVLGIRLVPFKRIIKLSFNITLFVKTCNFKSDLDYMKSKAGLLPSSVSVGKFSASLM